LKKLAEYWRETRRPMRAFVMPFSVSNGMYGVRSYANVPAGAAGDPVGVYFWYRTRILVAIQDSEGSIVSNISTTLLAGTWVERTITLSQVTKSMPIYGDVA
jgi:hypothetical protein